MVSDLFYNYLKTGMTREQVVTLLGEPSYKEDNAYYYIIGIYSGIIDHDFLKISFDKCNNVKTYMVYQG
jgi:outer membrane protein assembly factor BamE (lipoprotein component of BamABCDE complex)